MSRNEILEEVSKLKAEERFAIVEGILKSLDEPDANLDAIWAEEAERRLEAYRKGSLKGVRMEQAFGDK